MGLFDKESQQEILKVKKAVLRRFPVLGPVMSTLKFKSTKKITTAATDGKYIYYNPDFIGTLKFDEKVFIMAHEAMHVFNNHIYRSANKKDVYLWNIATDAVINQTLKEEGLPIIEGGIDMPEAKGKSAEQMYKILRKKKRDWEKEQEKKRKEAEEKNQEQSQQQSQNQNGGQGKGSDQQSQQSQSGGGQQQPGEEPDISQPPPSFPLDNNAQNNQTQFGSGDNNENQQSQNQDKQGGDQEKPSKDQKGVGEKETQEEQNQTGGSGENSKEEKQPEGKSDVGDQSQSDKTQSQQDETDTQEEEGEEKQPWEQEVDGHGLWQKAAKKAKKQQQKKGPEKKDDKKESDDKKEKSEKQEGEESSEEVEEENENQDNSSSENTEEKKDVKKKEKKKPEKVGEDDSVSTEEDEREKQKPKSTKDFNDLGHVDPDAEEDEEEFDDIEEGSEDDEREKSFTETNDKLKKQIAERTKAKIKSKASQAEKKGYGRGSGMEKGTLGSVGEADSIVSWKSVLKRNFEEEQTEWSYRRASSDNYYMARMETRVMYNHPSTEVMLDTSGSINYKLLRGFLRQLKPLLKNSKLRVACFDDEVYDFVEIESNDDIDNFTFYGRGGTDLDKPVRAFSKDKNINKIIFTDGEGYMPREDLKDVNVIWIVFDNRDFHPCCGKVIYVDSKEIIDEEDEYEDEMDY